MSEPLTERQEKILAFIKKTILEQGYPPTIREIGEHFGIRSTNGVNDHLKALERKGYLLRGELKSRALSVIDGGGGPLTRMSPGSSGSSGSSTGGGRFPALRGGRATGVSTGSAMSAHANGLGDALSSVGDGDVIDVPVIGKVAAGAPILAQENITDHVRIDSFLLGAAGHARKVFALKVTGDSM